MGATTSPSGETNGVAHARRHGRNGGGAAGAAALLDGLSEQAAPETLPQRIANELTTAIIAGGLEAGSPLPSFGQLAERFGVSRPVVREAVRILATQGLVEVRHGRVPTVAADDARPMLDGLTLSVRRRGGSFRDLYEVRRTLETEAAGLAAERRTDADLEKMRGALGRMRERLEAQAEDDIEADMDFHSAVTDAAHNAVLSAVMAPLAALLRRVLRETPAAKPRETRAATDVPGAPMEQDAGDYPVWSYQAHQELYDRIEEGDVPAGRQAALKHLEFSEARWASVQEPLSDVIVRVMRGG